MLHEGAGIAVAPSGRGAPGTGEAVGERGATALEQLQPAGRLEVPAERELQGEPAVVVARQVVGQQELGECGVAPVGEAVRLAGAPARLGATAQTGCGEVAGERAGGRDRRPGLVDAFDRARPLQAAERRVQRAVRHAPQRTEGLPEALLQLVAVEGLLLQHSEDGELEHVRPFQGTGRYIGSIYRPECIADDGRSNDT